MSDPRERPPEDDPLGWAPFGRASGDEPPPPLWSGEDPVAAAEPPPAAASAGGEGELRSPKQPLFADTPREAAVESPAPAPAAPRFEPPAPRPAAPAPPAGWAAPEAPSSLAWPPAGPAGAPAPPGSGAAGAWPPSPPPTGGGGTWPPAGAQPADAGGKVPANAVAALVLGLVGLVVCPFICSVAAIVLGFQARQQIDRTPGLTGRGQATAGIVLGVVGLGFFVLVLVTGIGNGLGTTL